MNAIDKSKSALLIMDFQQAIVSRLPDGAALVERTAGLLQAARAGGLPVIFVVVGFRPGYPEVSPRNQSFSAAIQHGGFVIHTPGDDIVPALAPRADEPIAVKRRVGAFTGSDLEVLLRSRSIDTLLLAGISTSGVVLTTTRMAADLDYRLLLVRDCCADPDDEVQRVLFDKVLPRQATIVSAADVTAALAG